MAASNPFSVKPASFNNLAVASLPCTMANNKCSGVTNSSPKDFNAAPARNTTWLASRLICCAASPFVLGSLLMASVNLVSTRFRVTLFFFSKYSTGLSSWLSNASNRCSVSIFGFCELNANCCACCTASAAFIVKFPKFIA